ncbi:retrovirus-related pol polyprotein from transposon TNT 1-94 [Tanacetum coccineum]
MKASSQGKDNAIKKLRMQISQLKETRSEADRTLDFRALDFQIIQLTEKVTIPCQEQNELFWAENAKVKQHYKELYDSIKITRAKHIEQTTALTTKNENLKAQINQNKNEIFTKGSWQMWKATGKVLTNVGYQWRPTGRTFTLGEQCPLTRLTEPKIVPTKQTENAVPVSIPTSLENQVVQIRPWYLDSGCFKIMTGDRTPRLMNFVKKGSWTVRFEKDHFVDAIMGYGDYVIGDSVISRDNADIFQGSDLWAEAVATACYTQNRSLIYTRHNKTSYELVHDKKPDLTFFRVFGALCYPTNDNEDLGKLQPTADIGIFVGYVPSRKVPIPVNSAGTPSSTTIDQDAPSPSHSPSSSALQSPSIHQGVAAESTLVEENPFAPVDNDPFINIFAPEPTSEASSSGDVSSVESTYVTQILHHLRK